jgi:hypothetical protein
MYRLNTKSNIAEEKIVVLLLLCVFYILYSIFSFLKKKFSSNYKSHSSSNLSDHFIFQLMSVLTIIFGFYVALLSLYNNIVKEIKEVVRLRCSEKE